MAYIDTAIRQDWRTPRQLFNSLDREFHFGLDAAADESNTLCDHYLSREQNGLIASWAGHGAVWCNPPYGVKLSQWIHKAHYENKKHDLTIVLLLPARTDTAWFHKIALKHEIRFLPGRLKFDDRAGRAPFGSMLLIMKDGSHA